jgi:ATP-dependent helicase HrpA
MMALGLGDVAAFPFIDRPAEKNIQAGYQLLAELGAIVSNGDKVPGRRRGRGPKGPYRLTARGRLMARLPLDPRLSRMLIEAADHGVLPQVTVIAAALSVMDPRERPLDQQAAADQAHAVFKDPASDFATLLKIWEGYQKSVRARKTWADVRRFCQKHFLNFRRMREWGDIHGQIRGLLAEQDMGSGGASQLPPRRRAIATAASEAEVRLPGIPPKKLSLPRFTAPFTRRSSAAFSPTSPSRRRRSSSGRPRSAR